jgi:hypothetical protein
VGCYAAILFAFAVTYAAIADQFYHSTAAYEPATLEHGQPLAAGLESVIVEDFRNRYDDLGHRFGKWRVNMDTFHVTSISVTDDAVSLATTLMVQSDADPTVVRDLAPTVTLETQHTRTGFVNTGPRRSQATYTIHDATVSDWPLTELDSSEVLLLGPHPGLEARADKSAPELWLDHDLEWQLQSYAHAMRGIPYGAGSRFERMLYFSASTMSTLGHGDILPITPLARRLASLQAIVGLALAGLFLNAVAREAAKGVRQPPPPHNSDR